MAEEHLLSTIPLDEESLNRVSSLGVTVTLVPQPQQVSKEQWAKTTLLLTRVVFPTNVTEAPNIRWIHLVSAGYDHILETPYYQSTPEGVLWSNSSGVQAGVIAEHVLMLALAHTHKLQKSIVDAKLENRWAPQLEYGLFFVRELRDLKMGILGYGCIGRECARVAKGFGMNVVAASSRGERASLNLNERYILPGTGDPDCILPSKLYAAQNRESFEEFLETCDIIVIAASLSPTTHGIISKTELSLMKKSAFLINIARGELIVQEDLVKALKDGTIAGAGLDVAYPEPLEQGHELFSLNNCIITPHVSFGTTKYLEQCITVWQMNLEKFRSNQPLINHFA